MNAVDKRRWSGARDIAIRAIVVVLGFALTADAAQAACQTVMCDNSDGVIEDQIELAQLRTSSDRLGVRGKGGTPVARLATGEAAGMTLTTYPQIPRAVLARILDVVGPAGEISPRHLMGKPATLTRRQLADLYAVEVLTQPKVRKDNLSPEFRRIAEVLLAPRTSVTLRMWGRADASAETSILLPARLVDGDGVILNQLNGAYQISGFVDDRHVLELLRPMLPPDAQPKAKFDFEAHLDAPVAAVLFGLLDLIRMEYLYRGGIGLGTGAAFFASDISAYLDGRWGVSDFSQLITYVLPTGLLAKPPAPFEVDAALTRLLAAGMIEEVTTNQYSLAAKLQPLVPLTARAEAGIQWQRVSLLDSGGLVVAHRIFVFGERGFILGFSPTMAGRLHVSRVTPNAYVDFLFNELTGSAEGL